MKRRLAATLTVALALAGATLSQTSPAGAATDAGVLTVGQRIINADGDTAGKCLDWEGGGSTSYVQMWGCNGYSWQDWAYVDQGLGLWTIHSRHLNMCLRSNGPLGQRVGIGLCVIQGDLEHSPIMWVRRPYSSGWVQWMSASHPGQCIDVRDYGTSRLVQLWTCLEQGNQRWRMQ